MLTASCDLSPVVGWGSYWLVVAASRPVTGGGEDGGLSGPGPALTELTDSLGLVRRAEPAES